MLREGVDVLVVDDDRLVRETLVLRLEAWGFGAHAAASVASAMELVRRFRPRAAIVDLVLPDRSGLDLLREVSSGPESFPIVLVTAHGGLEEAMEALLEGAEDVLTKPLRSERLRTVLETIFAGGTRSAPSRISGAGREGSSSTGVPDRRSVTPALPLGSWARRAEKRLFAETLDLTRGDEAAAARRLNLPLEVFRRKMSRYG